MVGSTTLVLTALHYTFAINVSLINAVQPTLTVFFTVVFFKEKLSALRVLGIICGIVGVVVMICKGSMQVLQHFHFEKGDLITLIAMCGFSAYALNLRKLPTHLSVVENLFAITVCGTLLLLPAYLFESFTIKTVPITATSISAIVALALLVSVFGNLLWNTGNNIIGPSSASMFINLIPVFGAGLAIFFLHEQLFVYHIIGGALVCSGIFLVVRRKPAN